jgi:hypothetical protein
LYQGDIDVSWTGTPLDGERHVKLSKSQTPDAVHAEFELDVDTPGPGGLTGRLDFDLRFAGVCRTATEPAKILMKLENARATADFDWTVEAMTLWLANLLEGDIADTIAGSLPDFSRTIVLDQPVGGRTVKCVAILVNADGGVAFFPEYESAPTHGGTTAGSGTIGGIGSTGTGTVGSGIRGGGGGSAIRK